MKDGKWSGRVFTSLCSLVSFLLLFLTGILLFVEPQGRVAYWTQWRFLGLEKDQWGNIHIYSGMLFLVAGGFHLYYNWKPLVRYLSGKVETSLRYGRELVLSCLVLLVVVASGIWTLPPLAYISQLGERIKNSWVSSPELEPPFGHAELVSLKVFCKKQQIPLDQAMAELRKAGFTVESPGQTLKEIAATNKTSGMGVYQVIRKLEDSSLAKGTTDGVTWNADLVEEKFAGTGVGRKTLGQIITEMGLEATVVHRRLGGANIAAADGDTLKDIADRNETTPVKVLTVILAVP